MNVSDVACPELVSKANTIMQDEVYERHMKECPHDNTLLGIELDPTLSSEKIFEKFPDRAVRAKGLFASRVRARQAWLDRNRRRSPRGSPQRSSQV